MSGWDDAAESNSASSALFVPKKNQKKGLAAPLLPQEETFPVRNNNVNSSGGGGGGGGVIINNSINSQVREQQAESLGSNVSDEIFYGSGRGLKLVYNAKTEEDFQRSLLEERERDIVQTTESIRKVNEVFAELGGLVQSQQHNIDDIENQV
jgi:hypothetical protein